MSARRRERLLEVIRRQGGEWTTGRVMTHYRRTGVAPGRTTARDDLNHLARHGQLDTHDERDCRVYTLPQSGRR